MLGASQTVSDVEDFDEYNEEEDVGIDLREQDNVESSDE